jgi:uridine kinase
MNNDQAVHEIAGYIHRRKTSHPLSVAVDGIDAAGKTTLVDSLRDEFERRGRHVIRVSIDGFHNPARTHCVRGNLSPSRMSPGSGRVDPGAIFYFPIGEACSDLSNK